MNQAPGFFHRRVGDILVTALHDGHQDVSLATVANIPTPDAEAILRASFRPVPRRTQVQAFLIRAAGRTALVDAGCGPARPTVGQLAANLAAAGVLPEEVDTILMTHLHPDHWGGLSDDEGNAHFPNAALHLHAAEHAYWHDDAAMNAFADPARRAMFGATRRRLAPYAARTDLFTAGSPFPGVTIVPLPGHTPGHTGFMAESGGRSLLIWADIVHLPEIQTARPEAGMMVDVDLAQAVMTRRRVFDRVATDRQAIAGMHLHFPAFAHLARDGDAYRLIPDAWTTDPDGDTPA